MYIIDIKEKEVHLLDNENGKDLVGYIEHDFNEKLVYIFSNYEIDQFNSEYNDLKNLLINRIPKYVLFFISIEDKGQIIEDLKEVPYPFNFIELVKCDNYATVNLSSSTEGENWLIR